MRRTRIKPRSADREVEQAVRRGIAAELGRRPCAIRAFMVCSGLDPGELTTSARGALMHAAKQLREVDATPDGIHERARRHRKQWPDATLTPTSLAKHYAQLGATVAGANPPNGTPPVYGSPEWEARQRDLEQRAAQLTGG